MKQETAMPPVRSENETLYLLWYDEPRKETAVANGPQTRKLADGLYLVYSARSRSELYHDVKRRLDPQSLLVAPLACDPKFKGMAGGTLKWLRAG
ncbi:MAG: hypothetical protein KAH44_11865 [Oricola sp.]|nr:hypothetical protein [Oricola sp.]